MNIEEEKLEIKGTIEKIMKSEEYDLLNAIAFDLGILLKKIHFYQTAFLLMSTLRGAVHHQIAFFLFYRFNRYYIKYTINIKY